MPRQRTAHNEKDERQTNKIEKHIQSVVWKAQRAKLLYSLHPKNHKNIIVKWVLHEWQQQQQQQQYKKNNHTQT